MIKCPRCNTENSSNEIYCTHCGLWFNSTTLKNMNTPKEKNVKVELTNHNLEVRSISEEEQKKLEAQGKSITVVASQYQGAQVMKMLNDPDSVLRTQLTRATSKVEMEDCFRNAIHAIPVMPSETPETPEPVKQEVKSAPTKQISMHLTADEARAFTANVIKQKNDALAKQDAEEKAKAKEQLKYTIVSRQTEVLNSFIEKSIKEGKYNTDISLSTNEFNNDMSIVKMILRYYEIKGYTIGYYLTGDNGIHIKIGWQLQ